MTSCTADKTTFGRCLRAAALWLAIGSAAALASCNNANKPGAGMATSSTPGQRRTQISDNPADWSKALGTRGQESATRSQNPVIPAQAGIQGAHLGSHL